MVNLYDYPYYYELAFSFRDSEKEVDTFDEVIRRFSAVAVGRVLEVGCGPAPHLAALAARGYEYVGLDLNEAMLAYGRAKAARLGAPATFIRADLQRFTLAPPVDFAFVLLGSLYVTTTEEALSHFDSVARALKPGGLYFLDWCVEFRWNGAPRPPNEWTVERDGVKMAMTYTDDPNPSRGRQLTRDVLTAAVDDHGSSRRFRHVEARRVIFPQEFLLLLEKTRAFEFIGWWNDWDLAQPIEHSRHVNRPITVIRRL